ncbi:hypothetical protein GW17_00041946, partial [Ensete ventricosum]
WAEAQSAAFGRHPLASGLHSAFFSATSLDLALQSTPFEQKDSVSLLFLLDFSYSVTLACSVSWIAMVSVSLVSRSIGIKYCSRDAVFEALRFGPVRIALLLACSFFSVA